VLKKPDWLRVPHSDSNNILMTADLIEELGLNTVCDAANCPNRTECFSNKTATFMILGNLCTRNCAFCNVINGTPLPVNEQEPKNIATAINKLGLSYVVITSVTRDDLPDEGALQFANVVREIRNQVPNVIIELLIPDISAKNIKTITSASPDVIGHNMETVQSLYSAVRPEANYNRSLEVLNSIKQANSKVHTKSGLMLGLGESREEVLKLFDDLLDVGCEFLTIGQYLSPSKNHFPVKEYITPEEFSEYAKIAKEKGFRYVASAPFVRSSYKAHEFYSASEDSSTSTSSSSSIGGGASVS